MPDDLVPFDAADHLRTPEQRAAYMVAILEDNDADELRRGLATLARAQSKGEGTDPSRAGVEEALGTEGDPGVGRLSALLDTFGLRLAVTPKGTERGTKEAVGDDA